jgi:hypothetical protein
MNPYATAAITDPYAGHADADSDPGEAIPAGIATRLWSQSVLCEARCIPYLNATAKPMQLRFGSVLDIMLYVKLTVLVEVV